MEAIAKEVLIIDDDLLVLQTLGRLLKTSGYNVSVAASGVEALKLIDTQRFDLIVSDIRMPGMNGIETLQKIREKALAKEETVTPAVLITGYAGEGNEYDDKALRIVDYVYKPFEADEFLQIVKKNVEPATLYERIHPRICAEYPARLLFQGPGDREPQEISCVTTTLSEGGISVEVSRQLPTGLEVDVFIDLASGQDSFAARAQTIWTDIIGKEKKLCCGLRFLEVDEQAQGLLKTVLERYQLLSKQFSFLTDRVEAFMRRIKEEFDAFDQGHPNEAERVQFLKANRKETFKKMTDYFDQIWMIAHEFDRDRYILHKNYYKKKLGELLLKTSAVNTRILEKPLGYPGDYVVQNYIFDYHGESAFLGETTYQKLINNYTCNISISNSNVARKNFLKQVIRDVIARKESTKIVSIGCGPARELTELLEEEAVVKPLIFKCLDLEVKALDFVKERISQIERNKTEHVKVEYIHQDMLSIIRDKEFKASIEGYDLIYLAGIFDYLRDKMAARMVSEMYKLLPKGGKLVLCNISLESRTHSAYYELLGDWDMIHRSKEEMLPWVTSLAGVKYQFVNVEGGENYHFLMIDKVKPEIKGDS